MRLARRSAALVLLFGAGLLATACGSPTSADVGERSEAKAANTQLAAPAGLRLALTCTGCHGGSSEAIPSLDSLTGKELESRLLAYKSDQAGTTVMHRLMRGYSDEEIEAVSAYLGSDEEQH